MDSKITNKTHRITTNIDGNEHQYYFWGVSSTSISKSATMTEYPTQEGTQFSDYKYRDLITLSLTINVTSYVSTFNPYEIINQNNTQVQRKLSIDDLKELITNWYESNTFLNIRTREDEFYNYQLTSISFNEDDNYGAWQPTLTFKETRIANIEQVSYQFPGTPEDDASNSPSDTRGPNNGNDVAYTSESIVGGVAAGAAVGAAIGSIFPGAGTAIGAGIGAAVGLFGELVNWW